jgi:gluconate 2-dehydrogenase gamma chain
MADLQGGGSSMEGRFFDAHQRATIEAAMARIIPTDDQPGAREAGTAEFLDRYLSGLDFIYAKPDGSGFEKLEGKRAEAWQRRIAILGAKYAEGIKELDRRSQSQSGADFVRLTTEQQDRILAGMERPTLQAEAGLEEAQAVAGFAPVEPALQQTSTEIEIDFFPLLALHTRQGFYADPIYGGNKNRVGWKLIGFEGPESLAETHAGRFTTLPFFAEQPIDWEEQKHYGAKA